MNDLEQLKSDVKEIKDAILGSQYHKGLVSQIVENADRLTALESFEKELSVYLKQAKVVIVILFTTVVGLLIKIFSIK
jgi:DNA uptake protein ComE-like DNA-binding protein